MDVWSTIAEERKILFDKVRLSGSWCEWRAEDEKRLEGRERNLLLF